MLARLLVARHGPDATGEVWNLDQVKEQLDNLVAAGNKPVVILNFDYGRPVAVLEGTTLDNDGLYADVDVRDEIVQGVIEAEGPEMFRASYVAMDGTVVTCSMISRETSLWPT